MEFRDLKLSRCDSVTSDNELDWFGGAGRTDMPPVQLHDISGVFDVMDHDVYRGMHISRSVNAPFCENDGQKKCFPDMHHVGVSKGDNINVMQVTLTSDDLVNFEANSKSCMVEIQAIVDGRVTLNELAGNSSICAEDNDDDEGYNVRGVRLLNIPIQKILRLASFFTCPSLASARFLRVTTIWHVPPLEKGVNQVQESLKQLVNVLHGEDIDYMYRPKNFTFRCVGYEGNVDVSFTIQLFDFGTEGVAMEFVRDSDDVIRFTSIFRKVKSQFDEPCATSGKVNFTHSTQLPTDTSELTSQTIVDLLGSSEPVMMNEGVQLLATATTGPNYFLIATLLHLNVLTLAWNLIQSSTTDINVKCVALQSIRNIVHYGSERNLKLNIAHAFLTDIIGSHYFETLRGIQLKRSAALLLKDVIKTESPSCRNQCVKRLQSFVPMCEDDKLLNTLHEIIV